MSTAILEHIKSYTEYDLLLEIEKGVTYGEFEEFSEKLPFTQEEWSSICTSQSVP